MDEAINVRENTGETSAELKATRKYLGASIFVLLFVLVLAAYLLGKFNELQNDAIYEDRSVSLSNVAGKVTAIVEYDPREGLGLRGICGARSPTE